MSRKDYVRAAALVAEWPKSDPGLEHVIEIFIAFFRSDNPRFDAAKFAAACRGASKGAK